MYLSKPCSYVRRVEYLYSVSTGELRIAIICTKKSLKEIVRSRRAHRVSVRLEIKIGHQSTR